MGVSIRASPPCGNRQSEVPVIVKEEAVAACAGAYMCNGRASGYAGHTKGLALVGHSNLVTTEVYTRADPSEKLEAIVPPHLRRGSFRPTDKLITLLKAKPAKF